MNLELPTQEENEKSKFNKLKKKVVEATELLSDRSVLEGIKAISYSQFSMYSRCPKNWELAYARKLRTYSPSIHTAFGTAFHETLQHYLTVGFEESFKKADEIDLNLLLKEKIAEVYKGDVENNGEHFSTPEQLLEFWLDGCAILNWFKKRRSLYFSSRQYNLLGIEVPLLTPVDDSEVHMYSFLDLVLYDKKMRRVKILDIKTSGRGWTKYDKSDEIKKSQVLIYKHFFSKEYGIPYEDIEVEFFIVKRKLLEDSEFPQKRIQEFSPAQGKIVINKVLKRIDSFVSSCFNPDGSYNLDRHYYAIEGEKKKNCTFCEFKDNFELCPANKRLKTLPD